METSIFRLLPTLNYSYSVATDHQQCRPLAAYSKFTVSGSLSQKPERGTRWSVFQQALQ